MKSNWISVLKKLPEPKQEVLVWNGSIWKSLYRIPEKDDFPIRWEWLPWRNNYATYIFDVTHWQPLPEPPKVKDDSI